jgi:DNA-binding CsgD family transcriptional regulator
LGHGDDKLKDEAQTQLTGRQLEVLERVVQRKPYKSIAAELDISETRVKQHVRTIKDRLAANTMQELVEHFHLIREGTPFTKGVGPKSELPSEDSVAPQAMQVDPGKLELADAHTMTLEVPWEYATEPRIVPELLDGKGAAFPRLLSILGIVIGLLVVVILAFTVSDTLSEQINGTGYTVENRN